MKTFDIIVLVVAFLLLAIAGGFAAKSASNIKNVTGSANDPRMLKARSYLIWSAIISFVGVFLMLVMVVLYFVYGDKADQRTQKFMIGALMVFSFILIFVSGILSALGATNIHASGLYSGVGSANSAYQAAIGSAVILLLGVCILILIYMFVFFLRKPKRLQTVSEQATALKQKVVPTTPPPASVAHAPVPVAHVETTTPSVPATAVAPVVVPVALVAPAPAPAPTVAPVVAPAVALVAPVVAPAPTPGPTVPPAGAVPIAVPKTNGKPNGRPTVSI